MDSKIAGGSKKVCYLGVSRMLSGDVSVNEWFAVEWGWLKKKGLFYGFELGGGVDGDNSSMTFGFNIGKTYNLPSDIAQLAYGVSVGGWTDLSVDSVYNFTSRRYEDEYAFNIGVAGPFVKARWKFIEFAKPERNRECDHHLIPKIDFEPRK